MLKSDFCVLNDRNNVNPRIWVNVVMTQCGYFIVNGAEKVIVSQEKIADNKLYILRSIKPNNKTIL